MIHAPRRIGIFRPWPANVSESMVFSAAINRVERSALPTWVHAHTEGQVCNERCQSISVGGHGTYEDLLATPPEHKV